MCFANLGESLLYTFISDYKDIPKYRIGLSKLANAIFGISFEDWYQNGYWKEKLIPYSLLDGEKIISNVSVNIMDIVLKGKTKKAIQLGTVMTHPKYRGQGLSAILIHKVLEEYKNKCDFIYLFANPSVINFYPKFGFQRIQEYKYSVKLPAISSAPAALRKLNISEKADLDILLRLSADRVPVSKVLSALMDQSLIMFYCSSAFKDDIYYLSDEDIIVIFNKSDGIICVQDIISKEQFSIDVIIKTLANQSKGMIEFGFTPDISKEFEFICTQCDEHDILYMQPELNDFGKVMFPMLSHT
jgi:GNAT superfamily N-acetyltransferase